MERVVNGLRLLIPISCGLASFVAIYHGVDEYTRYLLLQDKKEKTPETIQRLQLHKSNTFWSGVSATLFGICAIPETSYPRRYRAAGPIFRAAVVIGLALKLYTPDITYRIEDHKKEVQQRLQQIQAGEQELREIENEIGELQKYIEQHPNNKN